MDATRKEVHTVTYTVTMDAQEVVDIRHALYLLANSDIFEDDDEDKETYKKLYAEFLGFE